MFLCYCLTISGQENCVSTSSKASFWGSFHQRVKEQQPKGRGDLWASAPLCKLTASGGLLGEEKVNGVVPHLGQHVRGVRYQWQQKLLGSAISCQCCLLGFLVFCFCLIYQCDRLIDSLATSGKAKYLPECPLTSCALPLYKGLHFLLAAPLLAWLVLWGRTQLQACLSRYGHNSLGWRAEAGDFG